jgi:hypothetical protein
LKRYIGIKLCNGPFVVEYEESEEESNDLDYTSYNVAFTFQARLAKHPERNIGGLDSLKKGLADFEYIARINRELSPYKKSLSFRSGFFVYLSL